MLILQELREGALVDAIEKEGVGRSLSILENSFFRVIVFNPWDKEGLDEFKEGDVLVVTHADSANLLESLGIILSFLERTKIRKNCFFLTWVRELLTLVL